MNREAVTPSPRGGRETILVVDDEDMIRQLAVRMLTEGGYIALEARSVVEAKQRIEEHSGEFDLVMTDLVMPGKIQGFELARQICDMRPKIPVIFMSGYADDNNTPDKMPRSFASRSIHLTKPVRRNELLSMIENALQGSI